jgi:CRP-like cAMP-binding protein
VVTQAAPIGNHLLAALTPEEYWRLVPHLEHVSFSTGQVLYDSAECPNHVCFPTTAIVSLIYLSENGSSIEVATIGNRGIVGGPFFGINSLAYRPIVRSAGDGYWVDSGVLKDEFMRSGQLQRLLFKHTQALMTQLAQAAVCNRLHHLEQRLCRWLLLTRDCLSTDQLDVTQESLAQMLGVRREAVTAAAGKLQRAGLIRYKRGRAFVLDRTGLEAGSCECYGIIRDEYNRLTGSHSLRLH